MKSAGSRVTYADLQHMPDDGRRYELYDGELCVVPAPIPLHQVVVNNIKRLLETYAVTHGGLSLISPVDIVFSEYDVVQPDVVLFVQPRRHLVDFFAPTRHRPDLVVEVLSPGTTANDRGRKMQMFARYEVPEYWIVDPSLACIEVHQFDSGAYILLQAACGEEEVRSTCLAPFAFRAAEAFKMP